MKIWVVPQQRPGIEKDPIARSNVAVMTRMLHISRRVDEYDFVDGARAVLSNIADFLDNERRDALTTMGNDDGEGE